MSLTIEGGISKITALIISVLTIVSIIVGAVFWIVHQNDILQMQVMVLQEQVKNNSDSLKQLVGKQQDDFTNFDKMVKLMAILHDKESH